MSYHFSTKNGIDYRVAFVVDHTFSTVSDLEIDNVYQIIIEKVSDELEKLDHQVSATLQSIVKAFFHSVQNAIIYVCDDSDGKSKKRYNVFERWYQKSGLTDYIVKVNNILSFESPGKDNIRIYSSLLYHQENTNRETLLDIYHTIQDILNDK